MSLSFDTVSGGEEHAYLMPRSSLESFLEYMTDYAPAGVQWDRGQLAAAWKAAAARMDRLRETEPDRADGQVARPLPASLHAHAARVHADPHFRRAFSDSEWELGIVDLAAVVVSQKIVCLDHVRRVQARLGEGRSAADVFDCCLPTAQAPAPAKASRIGDDEFAFVSASNDLRFLEAVLLRPDQVSGYQASGPVAGIIGLVVGYGVNHLHVLSVGGRLILNNGHHRACALYAAGYRHVPCVVQQITHPDEIDLHAPAAVSRNPAFYLTDPRPPLIGDYFDPALTHRVNLHLTSKHVRVSYSVDQRDMP